MNLVPIVILTYNMGLNDSQVAMQSSKGVWRVGNRRGGQTVEFRVHNRIRDGGPVTEDTLAAKSPCAKFARGVSKW